MLRTTPPGVEVHPVGHTRAVDHPAARTTDLRDPDAVRALVDATRPDVVLHAAYRKDRASIVEATSNVATACARSGSGLVVVSSEAVFSGDGRVRDEHDQPDPVWDYGRWKAAAEAAARDLALDAAVVRLPLLVSLDPPDHNTTRTREAARAGEPATWFAGEVRPAAMASDVARGLWRLVALPSDRRSGHWHLPGPEPLSRRELGRRLAAALAVADPGVEVPGPPPTERPRDLRLGDARARHHLGWAPRPVVAPDPPAA